MQAGFYDNGLFPDMYTGPTNGSVMPMDNSSWPDWHDGSVWRHQCPLSATHNGLDGRTTNGHVDDYWISYGSAGPDPWVGNWTEHTYGDCTGDYMKTNQWISPATLCNTDGSTCFYNYTDGSAFHWYDAVTHSVDHLSGMHGLKTFFESRGYAVSTCYNRYRLGYDPDGAGPNPPVTQGITFADYKAEIDAGRPVLIHVEGHTMLGFGYDDTGSTVYLHDTWDYLNHTMIWGGSYSGMIHTGATVVHLSTPNLVVTDPNGGENWYLGSTHNITWISSNVNNVDISLYNSGSLIMPIVSDYTASLGSLSWPIPGGLTPSSTYKIRIAISDATTNYDESDANFTLSQPPSITVQTPNGGESWMINTQEIINWTSTNTGPNVKIELYSGGTFYSTIISSTPDSGNYPWDITTSSVAGTQYTIKIEDVSTPTTNDFSDSYFTLTNPPGYGQDDNSGNSALPVYVDVESVDIGGQMVDPDVDVDPAGSVSLNVEVTVTDAAVNPVQNPGNVDISYQLNITGSTSGVTMSTSVDFLGFTPAPIFVHYWDGASWSEPSNIIWGGNSVSFDFTMTTKDGSTEIILSSDNPLPVSLSSFTAFYDSGTPFLNWTTQTEQNNAYWNIYRSDSENFGQAMRINNETIDGAGTTSDPTNYEYKDEIEVESNQEYWYWIESVDISGQSMLCNPISILIPEDHNEPIPPEIPTEYGLYDNYPNPFNPDTKIGFALKNPSKVYLRIYNIKGNLIKTLFSGKIFPADQVIRTNWDGTDNQSNPVSSGVYFYQLKADKEVTIKRMLLIK